jgi:hypothetical protein
MKKLLIAALIVAAAAAVINDAGRYFTAQYQTDNAAREASFQAAQVATRNPGATAGWPAAAASAKNAGIEITNYAQQQQTVVVIARGPVQGTWVVGPLVALLNKQPLRTPLYVSSRGESYYR